MAILRKNQRGQYTVIDQAIFKDKALSNKALGMLCRMLSLPDGWEFSVEGLATLSTDGVSAVRSQLSELEDHGYLARRYVRGSGKIAGIEYVVSETKMCDFLKSENLISENLISEKDPQSNTKESITKESITKSSSLRSEDIYKGLSENLISALKDFEEMRKSIKKPIKSDRARKMLLNRLDKLAGDDCDLKIQMLDEAIFNNWQNVYLPKGDVNGKCVGQTDNRRTERESRGISGATDRSGSRDQRGRVTFPEVAYGFEEEA